MMQQAAGGSVLGSGLPRHAGRVVLALVAIMAMPLAARAADTIAVPTTEFLNSIGMNITSPDRGQPMGKTVEMVKYCGIRWVRGGTEGMSETGPTTVQTYLDLHRETGVRFSWGLGSGGNNLPRLIATAKIMAQADALVAFEGNNEPNNWGITHNGEKGGGKEDISWLPVAKMQRDLYQAVKSDAVLKKYPVWSISENGAERDNVGLQFLTIPAGANALMPDGTQFADAANCHNYIYHPNAPEPRDNTTWNVADPSSACKVDGLYGNYGRTWFKHFEGYSEAQLEQLPRVTTETGCTIDLEKGVTEEMQGLNLVSLYLDQFKRGWSHTCVYILRDRTDEGGNQSFGFFKADYTPRKAAIFLHNLTTILADRGTATKAGHLEYAIPNQPATVHDMLLQHSDGTFQLLVWGERLKGQDNVTVRLDGGDHAVTVYDPTVGVEPVQAERKVRSLELILSNHPLIIFIR